MRRTPVRLALVAAGLAAAGLALPAHAGTAPVTAVFTDGSGDVLLPGLSGDITKLTYTTKGTTANKKVGRKVTKVYTPDTLVITLETADAIDTSGTTTYEIDSDVAGCDSGLDVYFTPGVDGSEGGGCVNSDPADPTSFTNEGLDGAPTVAGNKITFTLHFKGFSGKQVKVGTPISGIHAYTALVEPLTGITGPYLIDTALANDNLETDATYKVG
jgi:hypothetical protein